MLLVLRSEIPSGMRAKLRTVAASNNRDHARNLSYCCLLALHIWWCYSSRTSRSWWIIQSTQHHRRGCNTGPISLNGCFSKIKICWELKPGCSFSVPQHKLNSNAKMLKYDENRLWNILWTCLSKILLCSFAKMCGRWLNGTFDFWKKNAKIASKNIRTATLFCTALWKRAAGALTHTDEEHDNKLFLWLSAEVPGQDARGVSCC